jgi:hypothetical protein
MRSILPMSRFDGIVIKTLLEMEPAGYAGGG